MTIMTIHNRKSILSNSAGFDMFIEDFLNSS